MDYFASEARRYANWPTLYSFADDTIKITGLGAEEAHTGEVSSFIIHAPVTSKVQISLQNSDTGHVEDVFYEIIPGMGFKADYVVHISGDYFIKIVLDNNELPALTVQAHDNNDYVRVLQSSIYNLLSEKCQISKKLYELSKRTVGLSRPEIEKIRDDLGAEFTAEFVRTHDGLVRAIQETSSSLESLIKLPHVIPRYERVRRDSRFPYDDNQPPRRDYRPKKRSDDNEHRNVFSSSNSLKTSNTSQSASNPSPASEEKRKRQPTSEDIAQAQMQRRNFFPSSSRFLPESLRKKDDNRQKEDPILSGSMQIRSSTGTVLSNSPTVPEIDIEMLLEEIIDNVEIKDKTSPIRNDQSPNQLVEDDNEENEDDVNIFEPDIERSEENAANTARNIGKRRPKRRVRCVADLLQNIEDAEEISTGNDENPNEDVIQRPVDDGSPNRGRIHQPTVSSAQLNIPNQDVQVNKVQKKGPNVTKKPKQVKKKPKSKKQKKGSKAAPKDKKNPRRRKPKDDEEEEDKGNCKSKYNRKRKRKDDDDDEDDEERKVCCYDLRRIAKVKYTKFF